jgi:phosphoglycerate dehydrogenase-like enzyme
LIAFGHVGQEVARRAKAFGLKVQAIRSRSGPEALRELLATSDFVVVACPLTRETKSMLIEERLRLLNPTQFG